MRAIDDLVSSATTHAKLVAGDPSMVLFCRCPRGRVFERVRKRSRADRPAAAGHQHRDAGTDQHYGFGFSATCGKTGRA